MMTVDQALQHVAELLDASLHRSEEDLGLWKAGNADEDAEIDS